MREIFMSEKYRVSVWMMRGKPSGASLSVFWHLTNCMHLWKLLVNRSMILVQWMLDKVLVEYVPILQPGTGYLIGRS